MIWRPVSRDSLTSCPGRLVREATRPNQKKGNGRLMSGRGQPGSGGDSPEPKKTGSGRLMSGRGQLGSGGDSPEPKKKSGGRSMSGRGQPGSGGDSPEPKQKNWGGPLMSGRGQLGSGGDSPEPKKRRSHLSVRLGWDECHDRICTASTRAQLACTDRNMKIFFED